MPTKKRQKTSAHLARATRVLDRYRPPRIADLLERYNIPRQPEEF